jgi:hypothetical protein
MGKISSCYFEEKTMYRRNRWTQALIAAAAVLIVACSSAQAQVKPFKATGSGFADWLPIPVALGGRGPAFHDADGTATELGNYHAEGVVQIDEFTGPLTATFSSQVPVVFTAANGDELHLHYAGTVELIPVSATEFISVWVADFTPADGSTGRFANVIDASITFTAITEPFELADTNIAYSWEGKGTIEFAK